MSERMACRLAGLAGPRTVARSRVTRSPTLIARCRDWLRAWAKKHPRYGYRRAYPTPGVRAGRSTTRRSNASGEPKASASRSGDAPACRILDRRRPGGGRTNLVWAVDFQFDADEQGLPDQDLLHRRRAHPRLGGLVERSITADRSPPTSKSSSPSAVHRVCSAATTGPSSSATRWPTGRVPAPACSTFRPARPGTTDTSNRSTAASATSASTSTASTHCCTLRS